VRRSLPQPRPHSLPRSHLLIEKLLSGEGFENGRLMLTGAPRAHVGGPPTAASWWAGSRLSSAPYHADALRHNGVSA